MANSDVDLKKAMLGKALLSQQPPLIRERLQADMGFGRVLGIETVQALQVSPGVSVRDKDLHSAARNLLAHGGNAEFKSLEGVRIVVEKDRGHVCLKFARDQQQYRFIFDELELFSSTREERVLALERIRQQLGASDLDMRALSSIAEERELSDDEVRLILKALSDSVARSQQLFANKLEEGAATLEDVVPPSWCYYRRFCGPEPGDSPSEQYLSSALPEHRKQLLAQQLPSGLEICLLGCLHDDLYPGPWLAEFSDDELWVAVEKSRPELDPFSCLGALDLAIYRGHDERFRGLAERTISRLTADEFSRPDSVDVYRLLPLLARLVLNRMSLLESGCLRSPLWRRLCAWMQANLVLRQLHHSELDMESLSESVESHLSVAGEFASFLDLRMLPMYKANEALLSPSAFRSEILGRLTGLKQRHLAAGREVPKLEEVDAARDRIAEKGLLLSLALPGPLEGHQRPADVGRNIPDELKADGLTELPPERWPGYFAFLSQVFHLDQELLSAVRETVAITSPETDSPEVSERFSMLFDAAVIAAAERDRELASTIANSVKSTAPRIESLDHEEQARMVGVGLSILLTAGSAIEPEAEWAEWLGQRIAEYAGGVPGGKISAAFWNSLQELKRVTKLQLAITSRAEAIASAAASH